jgi:hypothetical protein
MAVTTKERRLAEQRVRDVRRGNRAPKWKTPRGRDIADVTRDAANQVMDNYREALSKLRNH